MKVWNISAIIALKDYPECQYKIEKQYRAESDLDANTQFFADLNDSKVMEDATLEEVTMIMAIDGPSPSEMLH